MNRIQKQLLLDGYDFPGCIHIYSDYFILYNDATFLPIQYNMRENKIRETYVSSGLNFNKCYLTKIEKLIPLEILEKCSWLWLDNNSITDMDFLSKLKNPQLKDLSISNNNISKFKPFSARLSNIWIDGTGDIIPYLLDCEIPEIEKVHIYAGENQRYFIGKYPRLNFRFSSTGLSAVTYSGDYSEL